MARRKKGRDIHGVLLLDKPRGLTSNDALQKVKRLFNANKVGHTGALDPLATGMLPICFGEATKFCQHLLEADKRYQVTACLGQRTDTSDADGQIISVRPLTFSASQLHDALARFRGAQKQIPTMFSALKYQGKPLYEYARAGITIPREARDITVHALNFIRYEETQLELEIHCSKGTYIRTIIDDLGEVLGCGAHVIQLRRTQVADYPIGRMITLAELEPLSDAPAALQDCLLPIDSPVQDYPIVTLTVSQAAALLQGRSLLLNQEGASTLTGQWVRIYGALPHVAAPTFLGVGRYDGVQLQPKRLIVMHETQGEQDVPH